MSFLNTSRFNVCNSLESNYFIILEEYLKFNFKSTFNFFDLLRVDKNYLIWKDMHEVSKNMANVDESQIKLNALKKSHSRYELQLNDKQIWETLIISNQSNPTPIGKKIFPKTISLLSKFSEVTSISVAKFPANGIIPPHRGSKNIIRVHLGLIVPEGDIIFCVKNECRSWNAGKCVAFNDFYEHKGWNNTSKDRINLIVDLNRAMVLNEN